MYAAGRLSLLAVIFSLVWIGLAHAVTVGVEVDSQGEPVPNAEISFEPADGKEVSITAVTKTEAPDLALAKAADNETCAVGKICPYTVTVTNAGQAPYNGLLTVTDSFSPANASLVSSGPAPWKCRSAGATHTCTLPRLELKPGATKTLTLRFRSSARARGTLSNCAQIQWPIPVTPQNRTRAVQQELKRRGHRIGAVDGKIGRQTRAAIRDYERKTGLAVTGQINAPLLGTLFKGRVAGDANPQNDKACATVDLKAGPGSTTPGAAERCSGGQILNQRGQCVCPANRPVWTGRSCIARPTKKPPSPCSGGRVRNNRGQCVCPSKRPVWTGRSCITRPIKKLPSACPRGQIRIGPVCVYPPCPPGLIRRGPLCLPVARPAPRPRQGPSTTAPPPQLKMLIPRQPLRTR